MAVAVAVAMAMAIVLTFKVCYCVIILFQDRGSYMCEYIYMWNVCVCVCRFGGKEERVGHGGGWDMYGISYFVFLFGSSFRNMYTVLLAKLLPTIVFVSCRVNRSSFACGIIIIKRCCES